MKNYFLFIFFWLVIAAPSPAAAQEDGDCMACHEEGLSGAARRDFKAFAKSAHGGNGCVSCHADVNDLPHPKKLKPVRCGNCHEEQSQNYLRSSHGQAAGRGLNEAAACRDCHAHGHTIPKTSSPDSPVARKNIPQTCGRCHDDSERMKRSYPTEKKPLDSYNHTIHGAAFDGGNTQAAVCTDCHGSHQLRDSTDSYSRVFWRNIPKTCGKCHKDIMEAFNKSVHGQAVLHRHKEAPVCTTCHGEHTILSPKNSASKLWKGGVIETCAGCHGSERLTTKFNLPVDRLKSYMGTYHGLANKRGDLHVADCASCHGVHGILPHTDPDSMIHPDNIPRTCGKCHEGAGEQLSGTRIHTSSTQRHIAVRLATWFYLMLIPMVIGGMLLHNGLDMLRHLIRGKPAQGHADDAERMTVNERLQHAVNAFAFIALAYTGLVLKFPDAWWALPMTLVEENVRRWVHRGLALLFCFVGLYHTFYMLGTRRGRTVLFGLLPRPKDALEALQLLAYNAGFIKTRPHLSVPFNYIEKSEYWALLWGSFVMIATGAVLAFPDITLHYFPMWVSDLATVVHLYEAVLACLAIAVWHFYWVIFDPAVYPMSWVWLTGFIKRKSK